MRVVFLLGLVVLVSACGSKRRVPSYVAPSAVTTPFATGPIHSACLSADRKAASRKLCGCIQAVANQKLTAGEQSKAAAFFRDPQLAQDTRQNGSSRFWRTYKAYAASAERVCRGA